MIMCYLHEIELLGSFSFLFITFMTNILFLASVILFIRNPSNLQFYIDKLPISNSNYQISLKLVNVHMSYTEDFITVTQSPQSNQGQLTWTVFRHLRIVFLQRNIIIILQKQHLQHSAFDHINNKKNKQPHIQKLLGQDITRKEISQYNKRKGRIPSVQSIIPVENL